MTDASSPSATADTYAGDVTPQRAWEILVTTPQAQLIDVRTPAEWIYVGIPDLSSLNRKPILVPWQEYHGAPINAQFFSQLADHGLTPQIPLLLLCRSGVRSKDAAIALTAQGHVTCYNVAEGFEGDLDPHKHRATIGGWKVAGLPWIQN